MEATDPDLVLDPKFSDRRPIPRNHYRIHITDAKNFTIAFQVFKIQLLKIYNCRFT